MSERSFELVQSASACPACLSSLHWQTENANCLGCSRTYPIVDGIPILLLNAAASEHDEIDHNHACFAGDGMKRRQAEFFDRERAAEFEIARPHGTPSLYQWMLTRKFELSIAGLRNQLRGRGVLTVCGGSGMDAEYLAAFGARVISSDISLGAARRAKERARRKSVDITPIVADVERLPFRNRTVDVVYVHDGLHHLERPFAGLEEMIRVASLAISLTEPARAVATKLAIAIGLAAEYEEAGNRVARMSEHEVKAFLRSRLFHVQYSKRYCLFYRHEPGALCERLSKEPLMSLTRLAWGAANTVLGRVGNKLTVQAQRRSESSSADKPAF